MFCIEECFENVGIWIADGVGGNTDNIGVIVATSFNGFGCVVANSSADAFVAVGLHAHTLAGTANEDAKRVIAWIAENGFGDLAGIVVVIIFSVIFVCTKIREWNLEAREPVDDLTFELIAAMVGAKPVPSNMVHECILVGFGYGYEDLYVYGTYPGWGATGDARKFFIADNGIEVGDEITIIGYKDTYKDLVELCGGVCFSFKKANAE